VAAFLLEYECSSRTWRRRSTSAGWNCLRGGPVHVFSILFFRYSKFRGWVAVGLTGGEVVHRQAEVAALAGDYVVP